MPHISITELDLQRILQLGGDDLAKIYQCVTDRLRAVGKLETPNENVLSVRLPPATCDQVKQLALKHGTTRSTIVRQAVVEFTRRHFAF